MAPFRQDCSSAAADPRLAQALPALSGRARAAAKALLAEPTPEAQPILALPRRSIDLPALQALAASLKALAREVVVMGMGGSTLGGQALVALQGEEPAPGQPRLTFLDNLDPARIEALARRLDPKATALLVVSKSGGTMETLAQALRLLPPFLALPAEERAARVLMLTENKDSALGRLARVQGLTLLPHEPRLGGRFTVLSSVGLLPAALAGLDIAALRAGAASVEAGGAPAEGAALAVAAMQAGLAQQVLFVYADRLLPLAQWWRQLWAESLGKQGLGQTPVPALGAVDQHSQLQLYLDGPNDKLFTLVRVEDSGGGEALSPALATGEFAWLGGRRLGELFAAQGLATRDSLREAGRPLRELLLPRLDEHSLGSLLQHFLLETLLAADLLGLSPFGQPAVEDGKRRTRALLEAGR
jgi:glucose-6-phosphate isomerase